MIGGSFDVTRAEKADSTEVTIEAAGSVDYDMESRSTTAFKDVVLRKGDTIIECQELIYNGNTGDVKASGDVKITTSEFVYQTQALDYNINEELGDLAEFNGRLKVVNSRDYHISGKDGVVAGDTGTIFDAVMTHCPKPKPDYILTANRINYNSERVYLHGVVLRVKGIPVFYFPRLSFKTDQNDYPDIEVRYDQEEGVQIDIEYAGPMKNNRVWLYRGNFSTKSTNLMSLGLRQYYFNRVSNTTYLGYDFDGFWKLSDVFNYGTRLSSLRLDGSREFSDAEKTEVGIRLTRKYWETPIGRMQFGVLARDVFAFTSKKQEYGGTYWGHRLDYNPSKHVNISYLRLDSEQTNQDFRDFLDNYKLGDNFLYDVNIPLSSKYSLILDGNYNPDWNGDWVNRFYRIKYETCCFRLSAGWNDIGKSWEFNARIKF